MKVDSRIQILPRLIEEVQVVGMVADTMMVRYKRSLFPDLVSLP